MVSHRLLYSSAVMCIGWMLTMDDVVAVRMLLKMGYRHVYVSRPFATKSGLIPPNVSLLHLLNFLLPSLTDTPFRDPVILYVVCRPSFSPPWEPTATPVS